jgi:hypothetical protein
VFESRDATSGKYGCYVGHAGNGGSESGVLGMGIRSIVCHARSVEDEDDDEHEDDCRDLWGEATGGNALWGRGIGGGFLFF